MELNDILAKYESEENFAFYDLSSDLGKLSSEDNSLAVKAECLAMAFSEGGHDDWETFYGPTITWTVKRCRAKASHINALKIFLHRG